MLLGVIVIHLLLLQTPCGVNTLPIFLLDVCVPLLISLTAIWQLMFSVKVHSLWKYCPWFPDLSASTKSPGDS